jgi:hypothetical protein
MMSNDTLAQLEATLLQLTQPDTELIRQAEEYAASRTPDDSTLMHGLQGVETVREEPQQQHRPLPSSAHLATAPGTQLALR